MGSRARADTKDDDRMTPPQGLIELIEPVGQSAESAGGSSRQGKVWL